MKTPRINISISLRSKLSITLFLCTPLFFYSQEHTAGFPLSKQATKILVDSLANQVSKYYIEKEAGTKISKMLRLKLKEGAYNNLTDPHQLAGKLTADVLSVQKDEHFHIEFNPVLANEVSGNIEDVPKMVAEKLQLDKNKNFGFKRAEVLSGNIGYLELSGFSRLNQYSKETANAALKLLSNTSALIIDLRYGVGGSPDMVNHILSHFFSTRTHITDIYIRCENATLPYYTNPDSTYKTLNTIPIYILTSYKTFSAAEGLTYALKSLKRATIIGETTRGGAHTVTYRPLSSGFVADIPFGHALDPRTNKSWEGTGIEPDIKVPADQAAETAENLIFKLKLQNCTDSNERYTIRWQRDLLQSINHPLQHSSAELQSYTGSFGVYTLSVENSTLYYQKMGKARFPLIPMSHDSFRPKGNDSFIVLFNRDGNNNIAGITTRYEDARVEFANRSPQK